MVTDHARHPDSATLGGALAQPPGSLLCATFRLFSALSLLHQLPRAFFLPGCQPFRSPCRRGL